MSIDDAPDAFIRANTALMAPPHVPEIRLHLAEEAHDLWLKTEEELGVIGLPPPFWAFAWAGGQGLARHILDHPEIVKGQDVLDFASGSGIVAIAAARAGARSVTAADIDPWAASACRLNAAANNVDIHTMVGDPLSQDAARWTTVLAGDVFYDRTMTDAILPWLDRIASRGVPIFIGDPGRAYRPADRLSACATYEVPVLRALEDSEVKRTTVWAYRTSKSGQA
ncbi:class I SAM-dependent methyltransferase [Pararhizobium haloflavum]|uniref:class I SAM-dependent methyltransferase n=1 Tax=Pararhizobium haloflavum TaxID=2037914 RepID=UPI000C197F29|nr:methyltransferase [Pararhizobium haloflavum]